MTHPDLDSGLPSLYCSCLNEKHCTVICDCLLLLSLEEKITYPLLVFQQEEECQRIPQPAEGKRLSARLLRLSLALCGFLHAFPILRASKMGAEKTCRVTERITASQVFGGRRDMDSLKKELEEELKLGTDDPTSHAWFHGPLGREVLKGPLCSRCGCTQKAHFYPHKPKG